jgi:serine O-acetyltransferase
VVVGAGAKVLGNIYLGNNVRVGAGSVVLRDIPADCTVVGVPGRLIYRAGTRVEPLEHGDLPDSEAVAIRALVDRIEQLEKQVYELQLERSKEPDYRINCPVLAHLEEEASPSCGPGADRDLREFLERAV